MRGCGYECGMICGPQNGCGASFLDCLCPGENIYDDHMTSITYVGVVGVDYTTPSAEIAYVDGAYVCNIAFNVLTEYANPWEADLEISVLQNGNLVGILTWDGKKVEKTNEGFYSYNVSLNEFYTENGGSLYCVINSFSLTLIPG